MQGEDEPYFTDLGGRFAARLSHVIAARRTEAPSETTGITAKYHGIVKVEYQRDLMGLLEEGMLLAVRNFKSGEAGGRRYTLLEISRVFPEHYGLRGLSDDSYYPYQFEIIQQTVADWDTDDKATMMIQLDAIPLNYDLAVGKGGGGAEYLKGFTYPVIAETVNILNRDTIHQMYNRPILERMGRQWQRISTTHVARDDPRLGTVKMFEAERERIPLYVDFERLVRYHFGIFGFTGCGKSNLLSNVLRKLVYHSAAKVVVFDISAEYPFLLQDVLADEGVSSKLIFEMPIENAEQLYKVIVKPRAFEKDGRSKATFGEVLSQGKVGCYAEPEAIVPTYEAILSDVKAMRDNSLDKPNYVEALDAVRLSIVRYMKAKRKLAGDHIDEDFVDHLDGEAQAAAERFQVSEKSNVYAWATTRKEMKDRFELSAVSRVPGDRYYTTDAIAGLLEGEARLILLSIVDPTAIKRLAIDMTSYVLARRKREFKVEPLVLFVFDEAQEFVPAYERARGVEKACTEAVEDLLRQGRKYGLGGCIATQRIAYLNTNALQQLHTYFVGPLPRPYDRTLVSSTFTIDQGILEKTLEFGPGEWLLSSYTATGIENVPIFIKADDTEREIVSFLNKA
jgi:hypothetical protein